jgi:hypothetical protein
MLRTCEHEQYPMLIGPVPDDFSAQLRGMSSADFTHSDTERYESPVGPSLWYSIGGGARLLHARVSWKTPMGYLPMTFLCDTRAPGALYLNREGMWQLLKHHQLRFEENSTAPTIQLVLEPSGADSLTSVPVLQTPTRYEPANLMGLSLLQRLGLSLSPSGASFTRRVKWLGGNNSDSSHLIRSHEPLQHAQ